MNKRSMVKFAVFLLMCAMLLAGTSGIGFAQTMAEFAISLDYSGNGISYGPDIVFLSGHFSADVQTESDRSASGNAVMKWADDAKVEHEVEIDFTTIERYVWDNNGTVVGLDLNGHGKYVSQGIERNFPATLEIRWTDSNPNMGGISVGIIDSGLVPVLPANPQIGPIDFVFWNEATIQ